MKVIFDPARHTKKKGTALAVPFPYIVGRYGLQPKFCGGERAVRVPVLG